MHMFRLKILLEIEIQNYLKSNKVEKSHQRSHFPLNVTIALHQYQRSPIALRILYTNLHEK